MKVKINYIVIPLIVIAVLALGTFATTPNISTWYNTLNLPSIAPQGWVIGTVWTILYILIVTSALLFWNKVDRDKQFHIITDIFLANAFLNTFWSYVFFGWHQIGWAVLVSTFMAMTIYALIYLIYPKNRTSAILLVPYALWVTFATYLNYLIWTLN